MSATEWTMEVCDEPEHGCEWREVNRVTLDRLLDGDGTVAGILCLLKKEKDERETVAICIRKKTLTTCWLLPRARQVLLPHRPVCTTDGPLCVRQDVTQQAL